MLEGAQIKSQKLKPDVRQELPVWEFIKFNEPCKTSNFKERLRLCTNPDCLWIGTRSQAIKGKSRNQRHTPSYRCPECMAKIQNDDELERDNPLKGFSLEDKILLYLYKKPGSTLQEISGRNGKEGGTGGIRIKRQDVLWKTVEMLEDGKLYRIGKVRGRGEAKFFISSKYLFRRGIYERLYQ